MNSELQGLYPAIEPYAKHYLKVDEIHEIYVEECGNPQGLPILYVHGGPGSGCSEDSRRFFDPHQYRIILFDQRGTGRSKPVAELTRNNTAALVSDMEAIRKLLKIEQWLLFGGSWGSTLSLVYAQTHPAHVRAFILRGIFLARPKDLAWLYEEQGMRRFFPEYWQELIAPLAPDQRQNVAAAYYQLLTATDPEARLKAAQSWSAWELRCLTLKPNPAQTKKMLAPEHALNFAQIECHYMVNDCFLTPNQIIQNMHLLQHIPATLIHGRYDMVCCFDNAWDLHQAWPGSELVVVTAGHSSSEPEITDALIRATQKLLSH